MIEDKIQWLENFILNDGILDRPFKNGQGHTWRLRKRDKLASKGHGYPVDQSVDSESLEGAIDQGINLW